MRAAWLGVGCGTTKRWYHRLGRALRALHDVRARLPQAWRTGRKHLLHTSATARSLDRSTPEDVKNWRRLFDEVDTDGDELVTQADLQTFFTKRLRMKIDRTTKYDELSKELGFGEFKALLQQAKDDHVEDDVIAPESGGIDRFKDFSGSWHEASNAGGDVAVYEDLELSGQMRFYLVMAKGTGAVLWFSVFGTLPVAGRGSRRAACVRRGRRRCRRAPRHLDDREDEARARAQHLQDHRPWPRRRLHGGDGARAREARKGPLSLASTTGSRSRPRSARPSASPRAARRRAWTTSPPIRGSSPRR